MSQEPATLEVLKRRYGEMHRWWLLLAVMLGTMASVMSSTVVNVAVPQLSQHFLLGQERAQWVASGFMMAMSVSMLTTPWLLARWGYRRTYVAIMWLLMGGGLVGGFAQNFALVMMARIAEGLAAGIVQPIPAIIILRAFDSHERGRASGLFGMGVVLAPAIGPSVGGVLIDLFGWRSIFFMVVPLCLASIAMAYRFVPITAPGGSMPGPLPSGLDRIGLGLVATGTLTLMFGLAELHQGSPQRAITLLGVAVVATAAFIVWEQRLARRGGTALMNFDVFGHRVFVMGSIVAVVYGSALFGSSYIIPVFMQAGLGLVPSYVGTALMPAGLVLGLTIAFVGRLADHTSPHWLLSVGLVLLALSSVGMLWIRPDVAMVWMVALASVGRIGLGCILPSLNLGASLGMDRALLAQAATVINFMRTLGGAVGVSLCGIFLEWRLQAHGTGLTGNSDSAGLLRAFDDTFLLLALVCFLPVFAAWQMRAQRR